MNYSETVHFCTDLSGGHMVQYLFGVPAEKLFVRHNFKPTFRLIRMEKKINVSFFYPCSPPSNADFEPFSNTALSYRQISSRI